jgi:GAF domain-containing protein
VLADREYQAIDYQQVGGYRTALSVPMLQGETTIGIFALTRDEVNPFTEKHIELVINFAAQAVIAGRASLTRGNIGGSHTRGKSHSGDRTGWLGMKDSNRQMSFWMEPFLKSCCA